MVFCIIGIVGCNSLYEEIERFGKEQEIRLVQQGLHDLPKSEDMKEVIQKEVDEVDSPDLDYIALIYGNCGGGTEGIESKYAPIVIPNASDCIDPLKGGGIGKCVSKSMGTYYLTRGWMDCGNDPLKEFKVILDDTDDITDIFLRAEKKHQDMKVEWYENDKYQRIRNQGVDYEKSRLEQIFFKIMRGYDRVEIINNENLYDVHYQYAEIFRDFLQGLHDDYGDNRHVELVEEKGELDLLKDIIRGEVDLNSPREGIKVFEPAEPVKLDVVNQLEQIKA